MKEKLFEEYGITEEDFQRYLNSMGNLEEVARRLQVSTTTVRALQGKSFYTPSEKMLRSILDKIDEGL